MIVEVTNLTDGPDQSPVQIDIWNKILGPGESLKLPAELVDSKLRGLEKRGLISIGSIPAWYNAFKAKRGISISQTEKAKRISPPVAPTPTKIRLVEEAELPIDGLNIARRKQR